MTSAPLDVTETEILREELLEPWQHQERRIESIEFISDRHFKMTVHQQVWSPPRPKAPRTRLVSLGIYSKSRRPTLVANDASGRRLPILTRTEQAKVLSYLYATGVVAEIERRNTSVTRHDLERLMMQCSFLLERVVSAPSIQARQAYDALRGWLSKEACSSPAARSYLSLDSAWERLDELVDCCQVLVRVTQPFEEHLVLTHSYAQELSYRQREPDDSWSPRESWRELRSPAGTIPHKIRRMPKETLRLVRNLSASLVTRLLIRVGMIPTVLGRRCQNADHADSFYLLVTEPDGTACARNYWQHLKARPPSPALSPIEADQETSTADVSVEQWHSDAVCFAAHSLECATDEGKNRCYIEMRPSRSASLFAAWLWSVVAVAASLSLTRGWFTGSTTTNLSVLFFAVPAALTTSLTRISSRLSKRISSGLLALAYAASAAALLMSATRLTADTSSILRQYSPPAAASTALLLAGILFWILTLSRAFDGPRSPSASYADAKTRIRVEKVSATVYLLAVSAGAALLAAWLWP